MSFESIAPSRTHVSIACLMSVSLLLSACSGSDGGQSVPGVSSTTPPDGATGFARDGSISAEFDKDIFAVTVDDSSFTLDSEGPVSGNVTFDAMTNVATFTPSDNLDMLTLYTATVSDAVTDLEGNPLPSDYRWSFTSADGSWQTEIGLETRLENALNPQIAMSDSGSAVAVWQQVTGSVYSVFANRYSGGSWGSEVFLEANSGNAVTPHVAMDATGNAWAVWLQTIGGNTNVYAARFDGSSWGTPTEIDSAAGVARSPRVATDNSGTAIVVWRQTENGNESIWANRFDGSNWGTATLIESGTGPASDPTIEMDGSGVGIAVWRQEDSTTFDSIYANRFDGSSWGTEEEIDNVTAVNAFRPEIAMDNGGNATVVWYQVDSAAYNIWANRYNGTSWGTAEKIENDESQDALVPDVAMDEQGRAIAVWKLEDPNGSIWASRFDGSAWTSPEAIETEAGLADVPRIAMDPTGKAVAVWVQSLNSPDSIYSNRYDGTSWSTPELISSQAVNVFQPQVAIDSAGRALAVFTENQGSNDNILANRFE